MLGIGRRPYRPSYLPRFGDGKVLLAYTSASRGWFGEDQGEHVLNQVRHRHWRTGSPGWPGQPWLQADIKVWGGFAEQKGNLDLLDHLIGVASIHQLEETIRQLRKARRRTVRRLTG